MKVSIMAHHSTLPPIEWAGRVNRSWLVWGGLNDSAHSWMKYLEEADDGRLLRSCESARAMCGIRTPHEDPKPWFYAGLFKLATVAEAERFLGKHPTTLAAIPSMANTDVSRQWMGRVGPEARELMVRLRQGIASLNQ
jgi:hypothetical protein